MKILSGNGRGKYEVSFLRSVRARRYMNKKEFKFDRFPVDMLCFVTDGGGKLLIGDERAEIEPMRLYFLPRGTSIEASVISESVGLYLLAFEHFAAEKTFSKRQGNQLALHAAHPPLLPTGSIRLRGTDRILDRIRQLHEAFDSHSEGYWLQLQFQELLNGIVLEHEAFADDRKSAPTGIERAIAHMNANFRSKLDMGTVASIANLTLSSFSRLFKKTTGESPVEFLTKLRMDSAKSLLSQKNCTIKTVSSAVGYEDEFHFSRMFHRHVGVPPTFYRKTKKLRVAVAASLPYRDSLLSFGVEPVASVNLFRYPGMAAKEYELVFASQWEELERAKPDLIIGDFYHFSFRDQFQGVAPVSSLLADRSWVNNYRKMAEILGSSEEAEQAVNRLAMRAAAARSRLAANMGGRSIVVLQVTNHEVRIQGATDHPLSELLFGELGLQPGRTEQSNAKRLELQPEWLPQIDADYVFLFQNHIRAGSETIYDRMCGTHAWRSMRAVRNGNVLHIPNWFKMSWSPIGREEIIDELLLMTDAFPEAAKKLN